MDNDGFDTSNHVTNSLRVTLAMAWVLLSGIVDRFGRDHVGSLDGGGCAYVERAVAGRLIPSCIVGQVYSDLGILRALVRWGRTAAHDVTDEFTSAVCSNLGVIGDDVRAAAAAHGVEFTDEAFALLIHAQREQDGNATWGEVLDSCAQWLVENQHHDARPITSGDIDPETLPS